MFEKFTLFTLCPNTLCQKYDMSTHAIAEYAEAILVSSVTHLGTFWGVISSKKCHLYGKLLLLVIKYDFLSMAKTL
jgi:hypothetical protein